MAQSPAWGSRARHRCGASDLRSGGRSCQGAPPPAAAGRVSVCGGGRCGAARGPTVLDRRRAALRAPRRDTQGGIVTAQRRPRPLLDAALGIVIGGGGSFLLLSLLSLAHLAA